MKEMFLVGLHIGHSLSPAMWNHLFARTGRQVRYGLRDVGADDLARVREELRSGTVLAANVTMPHKSWAVAVADEVSEEALATGAANLLRPRGRRLHASNTDVTGARALLQRRAPYRRVLVVGAGGTAAAAVHALGLLTDEIFITNRTAARAEALAATASAAGVASVLPWDRRDSAVGEVDLVVNTVPVTEQLPFDATRLRNETLVYDVVYRRRPTPLQQYLRPRSDVVADGLAHLAAQAIEMLPPLGVEGEAAAFLVEGLEEATGRRISAWGEPLV